MKVQFTVILIHMECSQMGCRKIEPIGNISVALSDANLLLMIALLLTEHSTSGDE